MSEYLTYIESNRARMLEELMEFLKFPSVSADPEYRDAVFSAAGFVEQQLKKAGANDTQIFLTDGFPVVYGEKIVDPHLPTVLVYGHYDVQPPDPLDLWTSPPFEPVMKDDKIFARGACDDKGQVYMHIKALEMMLATGTLPCNVKFIIEGEEEVGSPHLAAFIMRHKEILKSDVVLISDTSMIGDDTPSINTGIRGLSYVEIALTGPNRDLHSGVFGGAVGNPINLLCALIARLTDDQGRITIPGFYDDVAEVDHEERAQMALAPFDLDEYLKSLGINAIHGEAGFSVNELTSIRPTLDVNGIWGGYTGKGAKTVLPSKAFAKISMRLVPNQVSSKISDLFTRYFTSMVPDGFKATVTVHHGGEPYVTDIHSVAYRAAAMAMKSTFGKDPIPQRSGGSIPIVPLFKEQLGVSSALMGFGLDTDNIHSPNEHFGIFNYFKGIETIPYFYRYFNQLSQA